MILLFSLLIPITAQISQNNLTFSYPSFSTDTQGIKFQGDAIASPSAIDLTKDKDAISNTDGITVGQATYGESMHLWDRVSGNLADFTTHFSFVINSLGNVTRGNGFAFFLAPNDSQIQSGGKYLGLSLENTSYHTELPKFVAVEFDTAQSDGLDPPDMDEHIGVQCPHWPQKFS